MSLAATFIARYRKVDDGKTFTSTDQEHDAGRREGCVDDAQRGPSQEQVRTVAPIWSIGGDVASNKSFVVFMPKGASFVAPFTNFAGTREWTQKS